MSEKRKKNTQWARYSHPRITMPEAIKAEASSKAESLKELKPDNKK